MADRNNIGSVQQPDDPVSSAPPPSYDSLEEQPRILSEKLESEMNGPVVVGDEEKKGPEKEGEREGGEEEERSIPVPKGNPYFSCKKLLTFIGPGVLMSIAYLDPGNIESDLKAGAAAKYKLLWVLLWSTILGLILQIMSAKLGVVSGKHLAQVCREKYPIIPRIVLWIAMELAIIGSDIQEIVGSSIAINIISQGTVPLWEGCLVTGVVTFIILFFMENYGLRYLEAFIGALIIVMCGMFGYLYIYSQPDQREVILGLIIPYCENCTAGAVSQGLGIVGAIIMPHNLYLHSGLVLSRAISRSSREEIKEGIKYNSIESAISLSVSIFINLFVICVFGAGVYNFTYPLDTPFEVVRSCTPDSISLLNAVECLYYRYGRQEWIRYIWAIGLLAAGMSSTMTGTYAGQFIMEGFLNIKWAKWKRVLLTRSIAIVPCVLIAILARNSLDFLEQYINVQQSLLLPFSLLPLLHATSNKEVMGDFKNSWWWSIVVWVIAVILMGVNIYFIIDIVVIPGQVWRHVVASLGLLIYLLVVFFFALFPLILRLWEYVKHRRKTGTILAKGTLK